MKKRLISHDNKCALLPFWPLPAPDKSKVHLPGMTPLARLPASGECVRALGVGMGGGVGRGIEFRWEWASHMLKHPGHFTSMK